MLTLLLLRHAKTEPAVGGDDFARCLTGPGEGSSRALGDVIAAHRLVPELALVSTARRTMQTFDLVASRFDRPTPSRRLDALYNANDTVIRRLLSAIEGVSRAMLVAHNPGIMDAAASLIASGDVIEIERLKGRFPPGGLAIIGFDADQWDDAILSGGNLEALIYPEDLAD